MTRIEAMLGAVAAAFALGGASAAVAAETAVDVPAQVFPHDQASAKPVIDLKAGPDASTQGRDWAVGRSLRLDLPVGARARLPLVVHIFSSEEVCHDNMDFTAAAAVRNQEQDFIRGGDH